MGKVQNVCMSESFYWKGSPSQLKRRWRQKTTWKIYSSNLSLKHADFPILDVEVVAELVHIGGDAVLLLGRLREQELAQRRRKEKDIKTDQECFLCLLLDKFVLLLKLLSQLVHLTKENETQYEDPWKLTTSSYIRDTLKTILVKVATKTSPWMLHKKADSKPTSSCFVFFSISIQVAKIKTPARVQRRFQSYDGGDYREVERTWEKNRIESCTRDTRFMTK